MKALFSSQDGSQLHTRFGFAIDIDNPLMEQRVQWGVTLFTQAKLPINVNDMISIVAWETAEGGGFGNLAAYNPLNTTQVLDGSWPINYAGVQSYTSYQNGLTATIETLGYSSYVPIIDSFDAGAPPVYTAQAIGDSPWGTPGFLVSECIEIAQASVAQYYVPPKPKPKPGVDMYFTTNGVTYLATAGPGGKGYAVALTQNGLKAYEAAVAAGTVAPPIPDIENGLYNLFVVN